jgi:subtilisin family serine protease
MSVRGPLYKLSNGLGVGDSEQNIKQAFGADCTPREEMGKNYLCYDAQGLAFAIHEKNRAATEIVVYHPEGSAAEGPREVKTLPKYDPDSGKPFQVDLRGRDLSKLDLRASLEDLRYADFDDRTVWPAPERMPSGFDWHKIVELGKNPGLGVRRLHEKGITGRGVRIAIIDQPLLVDHQEYAGRVRLYEEIDLPGRTEPAMHGAAVASLALGKTVGVAPEAELYYIAMQFFGGIPLQRLARSIHRIIEVNAQLPKDNKIRVISISKGWMPSHEGYKDIMEAVQKAQAAGMLIVCTGGAYREGFDFGVLGRSPWADPDVFESYEPGLFTAKRFWSRPPSRADRSSSLGDSFSVPMDSRTTASPAGIDEYVFYRIGGASWAVPYVAGVYALAVQADPAITPERFWALAVRTGRTIELERNDGRRPLGPIIDPVGLIRAIQAGETAALNQQPGDNQNVQAPPQTNSDIQTIVPGVGVGDYKLGMSKDEVETLRKSGEPEGMQFVMRDGVVKEISVSSPLYKFTHGLGVGDSEEKIQQALGPGFRLEEFEGKDLLTYENQHLQFEIDKKKRTVREITLFKTENNQQTDRRSGQDVSAMVRQAAAEGRIAFNLTTPEEFKALAGLPTREGTQDNGKLVVMEYPDLLVRFFGNPGIKTPHTVIEVSCAGRQIDIGRDRPIVLRHEGDLGKFGPFWGYSGVDLSRLDLSAKGELLKVMAFDSLTVWPQPDLLPPDFDPKKVMDWGRDPGLRVKQLHERGITGQGVHVAIIDQPLLLDHVEYKDQLAGYTDVDTERPGPTMHGAGVASLLVGKTCGTAPGAILHFWAEPSWKGDYQYRCRALEQIMQYNRHKRKSEQIRIVSVSKGLSREPNLDRWKALLAKAAQAGIYVVHCGKMGFGAGCRFLKDAGDPANYRLAAFHGGGRVDLGSGTLFTPIDYRTTASPRARDVYVFWTAGGLNWGAPYIAGVVALGLQVNPDLPADQIDKLLYDSGWDFQRGKLINPLGFVDAARSL